MNERDCKHGRLARQCAECELEREVAALTADRDRLAEENALMRARLAELDSDSLERLSKALEAVEARSRQYLRTIEDLRDENSRLRRKIAKEPKSGLVGDTGWLSGLGTVRACLDCGCLVAGGPTRCKRCAKDLCKSIDKEMEQACRPLSEQPKEATLIVEFQNKEPRDSAHGGLKHD